MPVRADDIGNLAPGFVHLVESNMPVRQQHRCFIMPRSYTYAGRPTRNSIRFAALGAPGPTLGDIVRDSMQIERPNDEAFVEPSKKRFIVSWPDVDCPPMNMYRKGYDGGPITRKLLAKEVTALIFSFFKDNPHIEESWAQLRLLALSYHGNIWVPILARDSD